MTWRSTAVKEPEEMGLKLWNTAAFVAKDRERWRNPVSGPIPHPTPLGEKDISLVSQVYAY